MRMTTQRDLIIEVFFRAKGHLNIDELYQQIRQIQPGTGYATIYRTMKLLVKCGLAVERHFGDGQTRYEHVPHDTHHDHMICLKCGSIIEFFNPEIERLQDAVASQHHFQLAHHRLEMFGYCKNCR
ncbi:MAG: transcriptional repressor [Deltaproteobacteria bacterium]|nr:transcriptional repressor [Deltaproteobacteria bacterium]